MTKTRVYVVLEGTEVMDLRSDMTNLLIALEENDLAYATETGQGIMRFLKRLNDRMQIEKPRINHKEE